MSIETMLHAEIESQFEGIKDVEMGTEEYKTSVDGLAKLMDRAIELKKIDIEHEDKQKAQNDEYTLKTCQMNDENKDRKIRNGIAIAGIVIPTVVTIWGTLKTFKFEETGTVTTMLGRGFINKLLPKK